MKTWIDKRSKKEDEILFLCLHHFNCSAALHTYDPAVWGTYSRSFDIKEIVNKKIDMKITYLKFL